MRPEKVKLVVGMISKAEGLFDKAETLLVKKFGPIDTKSNIFNFSCTNYYEKETGKNLKRKFISFKRLIAPERLARIKLFTIELERKFSRKDKKRRINLDPGYITAAKLVLATTKNFQHRIYLNDGIFAEVTLKFKDGVFRPCEWTYPDYRTKKYLAFFKHVREIYKPSPPLGERVG